MKAHMQNLIGGGWDQLYALMMIASVIATSTTTAVLFFLRHRLRSYFVTHREHKELCERLGEEHEQNLERLRALEDRAETLATKHSLNSIMQRQDSLSQQICTVQQSNAALEGQINMVAEGTRRVEHLMTLVLDHMLERDKP